MTSEATWKWLQVYCTCTEWSLAAISDSLMWCTEVRLTWPFLVASIEQSGMVLDSWTIQLLILSLRLRSTAKDEEKRIRIVKKSSFGTLV